MSARIAADVHASLRELRRYCWRARLREIVAERVRLTARGKFGATFRSPGTARRQSPPTPGVTTNPVRLLVDQRADAA